MRRDHNWAPAQPAKGATRTGVLSCAVVALLIGGSCGLFFLSSNVFPPFQESDESGQQFEIRRTVPGTVQYTSGWQLSVGEPQEAGAAAG